MVKYYIKITDEMPVNDGKSLWFELGTGENEEHELFVLDRNEYNDMHSDFIDAKNNLTSSQVLSNAISTIMSDDSFSVENTHYLVDSEDSTNKYDYSSLSSALEEKLDASDYVVDASLDENSTNPLQNGAIVTALNNKANSSTVSSLQSTVSGKANASHTHYSWTRKDLNDYSYINYNSQLRIAQFYYYKSQHNFTSTSEISVMTIPSGFRPIMDTKTSMYPNTVSGKIGTDGVFKVVPSSTGKKNINAGAMYIY